MSDLMVQRWRETEPPEPEEENTASGTIDQNEASVEFRVDDIRQLAQFVLPGASAKSALNTMVQYLLTLVQQTLDLYPLLEEASELAARGDRRWKDRWSQLRDALDFEQKMQSAALKCIKGLCADCGLRRRARTEVRPFATRHCQELTEKIYRAFSRTAIERALYYNMDLPGVTELADKAGIDLGLPREVDRNGVGS